LTSVKNRHRGEVPNETWFVCPVAKFGSSDGEILKKSGRGDETHQYFEGLLFAHPYTSVGIIIRR